MSKKKIRVCEIQASGLPNVTMRTADKSVSKVLIEELVKNGNNVDFHFVTDEVEE